MADKAGRYTIRSPFRSGGMAEVYISTHPTLKTKVLLKKLTLKNTAENRKRFRQEAIMMMELRHGNIVSVYDHFTEGRSDYLVQEFIDGASLEEIMDRFAPMDPPLVLAIGQKIAEALEHVHSRRIIHRDVKPSNILIGKDGSIKITDFGIAARAEETRTGEHRIVGTPDYMAPEQLTRPGHPLPASDLFGLGASLWEAATGESLYGGGELEEILRKVKRGPRPDWSLVRDRDLKRLLKPLLRRSPVFRMKSGRKAATLAAKALAGHDRNGIATALSVMAQSAGGSGRKRGKPVPPPPVTRTLLSRLFPFAAGVLTVFMLAAAAFTGRTLYDNRYGAFRVVIPVGAGLTEEVLRHGVLTLEPEGRILKMTPVPEEQVLMTRIYRARSGPRSLQFRYQDRMVTASVYLLPSRIPGKLRRRPDLIMFDPVPERHITFVPRFDIKDALTGMVPQGIRLTVTQEGYPLPSGSELEAGGVYQVEISAPGYQPRAILLDTPPSCRDLALTVLLMPDPVTVRLVNETAGRIQWLLNGETEWLDAGDPPITRSLPTCPAGEAREIELYPGWITVGVRGGSPPVQGDLLLEPGKPVEVRCTPEGLIFP